MELSYRLLLDDPKSFNDGHAVDDVLYARSIIERGSIFDIQNVADLMALDAGSEGWNKVIGYMADMPSPYPLSDAAYEWKEREDDGSWHRQVVVSTATERDDGGVAVRNTMFRASGADWLQRMGADFTAVYSADGMLRSFEWNGATFSDWSSFWESIKSTAEADWQSPRKSILDHSLSFDIKNPPKAPDALRRAREEARRVIGDMHEEMSRLYRETNEPGYSAFLALGFLTVVFANVLANAKNTTQVSRPAPRYISRPVVRAGGLPPSVQYRVLDIGPISAALRGQGNARGNGMAKALHICRGHFITFTPERPAFGRVVGTFWVPMHARGNRERGEVVKDYRVQTESGAH